MAGIIPNIVNRPYFNALNPAAISKPAKFSTPGYLAFAFFVLH